MSVVVPFPGARAANRGRQASRSGHALHAGSQALHGPNGLSVISWVRPASCACCGRPTLAARGAGDRNALCGHCSPPSIA
jgi:hypothetical protein